MHIHLRIHRWVVWWFVIGAVCAAVALINIFWRNLSRTQEDLVLMMGAIHWVLGGVICYAWEGIRIEEHHDDAKWNGEPPRVEREEWHSASDFLLPGNRKSLLPPRY